MRKIFKMFWDWVLPKTTIDEIIVEEVKVVKAKVKEVKVSAKETIKKVEEVVEAVKAPKRKRYYKKKPVNKSE